jgi:hypothetical protein
LKPYFEEDGIRLFCGDARDVLIWLRGYESVITDPVWPDAQMSWGKLIGSDDPVTLFKETAELLFAERLAVQLGCDTDPRILSELEARWNFFRVANLEVAKPGYKGRLLMTGDIAYLFGNPPKSREGKHLIPGRTIDSFARGRESDHPCPRKLSHVEWLVSWWSEPTDTVLDPFCGSGTTLLAAKNQGRKAIGIEIDEQFCEMAAERLSQKVLQFDPSA